MATHEYHHSRDGCPDDRHSQRDSASEASARVETPSGKDAESENFPVGSWLLPAGIRQHVKIFYAFARAIDDIADNPDLPPAEKVERLNGFDRAVRGIDNADPAFQKGHEIRQSLVATAVTDRHCRDLIRAFRQDATKSRYADWDQLIGYCNLSAAPVGRYLIDLQGEPATAYPTSDALCNALQVLNHLQDCGCDYRTLDRVYLPGNWMLETGMDPRDLGCNRSTTALRRVLDRCLQATAQLLETAVRLPAELRGFRFSLEAAVIVAIARRLTTELRRRDPLAERVTLNRIQFAACCLQGVCHALLLRVPGQTSAKRRRHWTFRKSSVQASPSRWFAASARADSLQPENSSKSSEQ